MCFRNREAAPKCAYMLVLIWSLWSLLATQAQTNTWHAWPGQRLEELLTVNQLWRWRCLPKLPSAGTCCVQRKSHKINITNIKHLAAEDWEQRLGKMDHFYVSRRISSPAASCFNDWTDDRQPHCPQTVRLARPGLVSGGGLEASWPVCVDATETELHRSDWRVCYSWKTTDNDVMMKAWRLGDVLQRLGAFLAYIIWVTEQSVARHKYDVGVWREEKWWGQFT